MLGVGCNLDLSKNTRFFLVAMTLADAMLCFLLYLTSDLTTIFWLRGLVPSIKPMWEGDPLDFRLGALQCSRQWRWGREKEGKMSRRKYIGVGLDTHLKTLQTSQKGWLQKPQMLAISHEMRFPTCSTLPQDLKIMFLFHICTRQWNYCLT